MHLTEISLIAVVILGITYASDKGSPEWSYKDKETLERYQAKNVYGPKDWGKAFKTCKGKAQSPIDIDSKKAKKTKFGPLKLKFEGDKEEFFAGNFSNNGHSPTFTLDKSKGNISIEFDKKTYLLHQVHFHFGCINKNGSEHTIDKTRSTAEMHLVFHNKKVKFDKAIKEKDGLLVIGVLIEKAKDPFYHWGRTDGLDGLLLGATRAISSGYVRIGIPIVGMELPLKKLVPSLSYKDEKDTPAYYTYKGSLTTPGCYETVRWVVLKKPIKISGYMLSLLQNLKTKVGMYFGDLCDNYRPTQELNKRKVEVFEPKKKKN